MIDYHHEFLTSFPALYQHGKRETQLSYFVSYVYDYAVSDVYTVYISLQVK